MYQTSLFPLRTCVGRAIPIEKSSSIKLIRQSAQSRNQQMNYDFALKPDIDNTVGHDGDGSAAHPGYKDYLPVYEVDGIPFSPRGGMDTLPVPAPPFGLVPTFMSAAAPPFAPDSPVVSLFAYTETNANPNIDLSRRLSSTFLIDLGREYVVGGICFGGYPYLPYSNYQFASIGMNHANFGLPREVRLVCLGARTEDEKDRSEAMQFLDSEYSVTKQDVVSHSGFHFLASDPVKTRLIQVRFSDYPVIVRRVRVPRTGSSLLIEAFYGFIIPYFYVYEYEESTRYRPQVSAGLLGVKSPLPTLNPGALPGGRPDADDLADAADAANAPANELIGKSSYALNFDFRYSPGNSDEQGFYYDYTAASIFGQQREYKVEHGYGSKECFISAPVKNGNRLIIYAEQAEDYQRCIAGLTMLMPFIPEEDFSDAQMESIVDIFNGLFGNNDPNDQMPPREELETFLRMFLRIPPDINFCEKIGLRVFEIDPPEGVSPVSVDPDDKYSTLLAEQEIDTTSEIILSTFFEGIKFTRPSNSRYFAIELTNNDDEAAQFVIKALRLMQSAHVSIHPRAARAQQVRTLNFRIIGANLAADYAKLGDEGFNFSIERMIAGERKSVLFRANSLMDLLHTGAAKIFSNVRRRAVEFEKSEMYPVKDADGDPKYLVPGEYREIVADAYLFRPNYERRSTESRVDGWRRSETGHEVAGKDEWYVKNDQRPNINRLPEEFKNQSNAEMATHNEILSPQENVNEWKSNAYIGNAMYNIHRRTFQTAKDLFEEAGVEAFLGSDQIWIPTYNSVRLYWDFEDVNDFWKGIVDGGSPNSRRRLKVYGMKSVTSSPLGINALTTEFFDFIDALRTTDPNVSLEEGLDFAGLMAAAYITKGRVFALSVANSLSVGMSVTPVGLGFSFSASTSGGLLIPSYTYVNSFGTQGSITKQASKTGYAYSQYLNASYDEGDTYSEIKGGETKRIITRREVPARGGKRYDTQRVRGAEVMWQGEIVDIISGAIPVNFELPATASKMHFRTADDSLRVRFGSGVGKSLSVDFWFDITEEVVKDDY